MKVPYITDYTKPIKPTITDAVVRKRGGIGRIESESMYQGLQPEVCDILDKLNEVIDRVNELSSPEKKEEPKWRSPKVEKQETTIGVTEEIYDTACVACGEQFCGNKGHKCKQETTQEFTREEVGEWNLWYWDESSGFGWSNWVKFLNENKIKEWKVVEAKRFAKYIIYR